MKKRIYLSFISLILLSALLLSAAVSIIVFNVLKNQEEAAIRDRAVLIADFLNRGAEGAEFQFSEYFNYHPDVARLTIIAYDGTVLLDNKVSAKTMENHGDREEFIAALETGSGEMIRYSDTLRNDTYYYAIRLDNGNVLRISKTLNNINSIFSAVWPVLAVITAFILLLANFAASLLTRLIVKPFEFIDFDNGNMSVYDELAPFIKRINQQKTKIDAQIDTLKNRADTIEIITSNMKEGLILVDKTGIILIANHSAGEVFHENEMSQKHILNICRDLEFQKGVKQCLFGENTDIIYQIDDKIYNIHFSPARNESGIIGGVILFFEMTEKYEAEKQRREFSANVSHELKTPLTSISALSEMIGNGMAKQEDVQGFAVKISEHSERLIDVINDIIKLSEFDEGKADQSTEIFDLYELAETVADALKENGKNVTITISGERYRITANRRMIDELLYNLIDNGIKYNRQDGAVSVSFSRENGMGKITVHDTGIGIPAEHYSRIFERFYRVDKSRSKKTGGTGLGLSIVKHVAERHGGKVELESAVGVGTTIVCWLPL